MRILPRYFAVGFLASYAAILLVSLVAISIVEMMLNFDHALEHGNGLAGAASYLFLRLPSYYLPYLIPIGAFGAAFLALGLPARSLEVLAAKASGIAPQRLAAPVLAAAVLLCGLSFAVGETLVLETARRFDRVEVDADAERKLFQSKGSFWYHRGPTLLRVESANRDTRTLHGVQIWERGRTGRLERSIRAERARIEDDQSWWRLESAVIREFPADRPEAPPRTRVEDDVRLEIGSAEDLALLDADPRSLSLRRLGQYIDARSRDGRDTAQMRALWHARLTEPLSVLLFALLGAPLGAAVEQSRSLAAPALRGVALVGAYYVLQTGASLAGGALASVAPWLLLGAFGAWGLRSYARMGR